MTKTEEAGFLLKQAVEALYKASREYDATKGKRKRAAAGKKCESLVLLVDERVIQFHITALGAVQRLGYIPRTARKTIAYMRARGMNSHHWDKWEKGQW